jgi:hypothetical protein
MSCVCLCVVVTTVVVNLGTYNYSLLVQSAMCYMLCVCLIYFYVLVDA